MANASIKPEIKVDPAASTPQDMSDIKEFEPKHDLIFPTPPSEGGHQAWLVKLPSYLWQQWNDIYKNSADDEPIEIGKMRVKVPTDPNQDPMKQQIQIRLATGPSQHRGLPMNYNVKLKTNGYDGTVVFSEKDDLDYEKKKNRGMGSKPAGIQPKRERYGQNYDRNTSGGYRTVIPKHTALAPVIHHVADALPRQDETYAKFERKQWAAGTKPKSSTIFTDKIDKSLHPAARGNLSAFNAFGLSSRPTGKKKPKTEKAVRIPQGELLDALDKCFRRYKYWSLKSLRNELKQPEAYIKSTLEQIAFLIRSGNYALTYKLKPEYSAEHQIKDEDVKEEHKEEGSDEDIASGSESGEESEDEEGFEDVNMEG